MVIDHTGLPDVSKPVDGPGFQKFVRLIERDNIWSKVTCPERLSVGWLPDYADVVPLARHLVERLPDRLLWGTDRPHPNLRADMPDDGKAVDFTPRIAPDVDAQAKLLVDNPTRPYRGR